MIISWSYYGELEFVATESEQYKIWVKNNNQTAPTLRLINKKGSVLINETTCEEKNEL